MSPPKRTPVTNVPEQVTDIADEEEEERPALENHDEEDEVKVN